MSLVEVLQNDKPNNKKFNSIFFRNQLRVSNTRLTFLWVYIIKVANVIKKTLYKYIESRTI